MTPRDAVQRHRGIASVTDQPADFRTGDRTRYRNAPISYESSSLPDAIGSMSLRPISICS